MKAKDVMSENTLVLQWNKVYLCVDFRPIVLKIKGRFWVGSQNTYCTYIICLAPCPFAIMGTFIVFLILPWACTMSCSNCPWMSPLSCLHNPWAKTLSCSRCFWKSTMSCAHCPWTSPLSCLQCPWARTFFCSRRFWTSSVLLMHTVSNAYFVLHTVPLKLGVHCTIFLTLSWIWKKCLS